MNINKIVQQVYINDFKESKIKYFHEFIKKKLKNVDSKKECILNCYMLFTFYDWDQIIQWNIFNEILIDHPHLSIYKVICESHNDLQNQLIESHNQTSKDIYYTNDLLNRFYNEYRDEDGNVYYTSSSSGV